MIDWHKPIEVVTEQECLPAFIVGVLKTEEDKEIGALVGCNDPTDNNKGILLEVFNNGKSLETGMIVIRNINIC